MPPCNDRAAGPQHAGAERGSADPRRDDACNGSEPRRTLSVLRLPVWPRLLRRRLTRNGGHVVRKDEWRVQEVYAKGQMVRFWSQLCRFAQHAGYVIPATSARQEDTMVEGPVNWMPEARPSSPSRCSATTVRSDRVTKTAWHADSSARGRRGGRAGGRGGGDTPARAQVGYHTNEPVAVLDFASMYPSIIIAHNLVRVHVLALARRPRQLTPPTDWFLLPAMAHGCTVLHDAAPAVRPGAHAADRGADAASDVRHVHIRENEREKGHCPHHPGSIPGRAPTRQAAPPDRDGPGLARRA